MAEHPSPPTPLPTAEHPSPRTPLPRAGEGSTGTDSLARGRSGAIWGRGLLARPRMYVRTGQQRSERHPPGRPRANTSSRAALKRGCDVAAAALGLTVLLPLGVCAAVAVALDDGRPILYGARRAGRGGAPFTMYKFRTMRRDAAARGPAITGARDPRVTRVGGVLRATRLDELPQLWNVLRGDMSLVGPRPEDPAFVALYTPEQRSVLTMRPGITGPAQLVFADEARLLRPGHEHEDYVNIVLPAKLAIDREYVANPSPWRDLRVIAGTLGAVLQRR